MSNIIRFGSITILSFLFLCFTVYLLLPAPAFPLPPDDSVQSMEEADTESPLRRAYFTNYDRVEVLDHYQKQFSNSSFLNIPYITYRLNYPPEESQVLIRDQTRTTFLEEINHPLRESLFVNGFEPKEEKDDIWYKGTHYEIKIIVRYVPGNVVVRVFTTILMAIAVVFLFKGWKTALGQFFENIKK